MRKGRPLAEPPFPSTGASRHPRNSQIWIPAFAGITSRASRRWRLLELDGAAGFFDLLLDLFGFVLVDAFLDGLRSAFDERLGFAETQAGDGADFLDDVDLLATVAGEDHVEFGLFFFSRRSGSSR